MLSRLGDLSLPSLEDEELTILPHASYSEAFYQAGSWRSCRHVCQFSHRKEGELLYDVVSLVTNMTGGSSEEHFQLYRQRGQAENFIKEMKHGFFGDKTDSSTMLKNKVRMMLSCIACNLFLYMKHLVGGGVERLTIKRFRQLYVAIAGKCVQTARKQILKLSQLYAYQEQFRSLFHCISNLNLRLPVVVQAGRQLLDG